MDAKYKKLFLISISLSLLALFIVIIVTFDENTISNLSKVNGWFIAGAFGIHILAIFFWGCRIMFLCRSLGYKVNLGNCMNMAAAGQLLASITPSSIGGEPVRIHELYKAKLPVADATAIVIIERLLEAVLLIIGVIFGMTTFSLIYNDGEINSTFITLAWCGTGLFTTVLIVLVLVMRKPDTIKHWGKKLVSFFTKKMKPEQREKILTNMNSGIDQFYSTFRYFGSKAKWGLVVGFIFSLLFWSCEYAIASIIMVGLGFEPNLLLSIIFQLIIAVILMIPMTPGSTGVAEGVYCGFYGLLNLGDMLGPFVIILRLILYYSNLILGFIASFIILKRESRTNKVTPNEN